MAKIIGFLFLGNDDGRSFGYYSSFAFFVIAHARTLADGRVLGVAGERVAGAVALSFLYLQTHIARGRELQPALGRQADYLVANGVVILALGNIDHRKGAKRLNGHTVVLALDNFVADGIEHMGQHGFDRGAANATALHYLGRQSAEVNIRLHCWYVKILKLFVTKMALMP